MAMVFELPLVTGAEIAAEYRPGGEPTVKATLRRLRERRLISSGVVDHPRGAKGKVAGAWHVYSALNIDAARAARSDDQTSAKAIAGAAARIERRRQTLELVRQLGTLDAAASLRQRFEWASSLETEKARPLRALIEATLAERNRLVHDPAAAPRLARITDLRGDTAELTLDGQNVPISVAALDLEAQDSAFVGAFLALRFERFGRGQTLLKVAPAIKLDDEDDAQIYPYQRPLPAEQSPLVLVGALSAQPTIRTPQRIPIAGSR